MIRKPYWAECTQCPEPHLLLVGVTTVNYGWCPVAYNKAFEALSDEALLGRKEEVGLNPAKGPK
jgi:hypothetical protein